MATDKKSRLKEILGKAGKKIVDVTSDVLSAPSRAISNFKANQSKRDLETIIKGRKGTEEAEKESGYKGTGSWDERQKNVDMIAGYKEGDSFGMVPDERSSAEKDSGAAYSLKNRIKSKLSKNNSK